MIRNKSNAQAVRVATKANAQFSEGSVPEHGKSNTCSKPLQQGILPKRVSTKERMTKTEANRKNALRSTGPKTPRGKSHSRRNARKHGLYSKELLVSEADRPEFERMRVGLETELKPSKTLRWFAFDYCVVCHWRCKLALRLERRQFARLFQDEQHENTRGEAPDVDPVIERWYGSSRSDTLAGIRALEDAMIGFEKRGYLGEETKKFLTSGFGSDFVQSLEEWNTMSRDAILLADQIVSHNKDFADVPDDDVKPSSPAAEKIKVVIDPMQGRHMVGKLLQQQWHSLKNLLLISDRHTLDGNPDAAQSSDFNPRFLADANREVRRALDWYWSLKDRRH